MTFNYANDMKRSSAGSRKTKAVTDLSRWRMCVDAGKQRWQYIKDGITPKRKQNVFEKYALGLDTSDDLPALPRARTPRQAAHNGMEFFSKLQTPDGKWPGEFSGFNINMAVFISVQYIMKIPFLEARRLEMIRHMRSIQCPDGGWGNHIASGPTVLGTALMYVAMRVLGVAPEDEDLVKARNMMKQLGGVVSIPTFGKLWLAVMNCYKWEGVHAVLPELWLLPEWFPIHPSKLLIHTRFMYLCTGYIFAMKLTADETDLVKDMRKELYPGGFETIDWPAQKNNVNTTDLLVPHSWLTDISLYIMDVYDRFHVKYLREKALKMCYDHICYDGRISNGQSSLTLCAMMEMLIQWYSEGRDSPGCKVYMESMEDCLWMGSDGLKVCGQVGPQLWELCFAVSAYFEAGAADSDSFRETLCKAHNIVRKAQIQANPPDCDRYYRDLNKGAFGFTLGNPVLVTSDCAAEGLACLLLLQDEDANLKLPRPVPMEKLRDTVDFLLEVGCENGTFTVWEKQRGHPMLEHLNATEIFAQVMVEHSFVECTSSVLQALDHFTSRYPEYRVDEIKRVKSSGFEWIRRQQRPDGSWEGFWGICFTYCGWFALQAYETMGYGYHKNNVPEDLKRGCEFLVGKQNPDGGWGEKFESCERREYVTTESSVVVNTSWVLLGLMAVRYPQLDCLERGIRFIMEKQLDSGDWEPESISMAAFRFCGLTDSNFKNIFPIWTLGRFSRLYPTSRLVQG